MKRTRTYSGSRLRSSGPQARKRTPLLGGLWRTLKKREDKGPPDFCSIVDLGTEHVKALVVEQIQAPGATANDSERSLLPGDWRATVIGQGRARRGSTRLGSKAVAAICDRALRAAEDMTEEVYGRKIVPDRVVMGVSASVVHSAAYTFRRQRHAPQRRIEPQELEGALDQAQRLALLRLQRESGLDEGELSLVSTSIVEINVDGHRVTDPIGFRGQVLTITIFNALAEARELATLKAIADELELAPALLALEGQALACSLVPKKEALVFDIGGRATTVCLIRNGALVALRVLPCGGYALTEHLARAFGLTSQRAEALKIAYNRGKLQEKVARSTQKTLAPVIEAWLLEAEKALEELALQNAETLPHRLYLCGGGSELTDIIDRMRAFAWMRALPFDRHPEVQFLSPSAVPHVPNRTGLPLGREGTTVVSLARWASTLRAETSLSTRLLNKITTRNLKALKVPGAS